MADTETTEAPRETEHPLNQVVQGWLKKIKLARDDKKIKFQDDANEAMAFFDGGKRLQDLMWSQAGKDGRKGFVADSEDGDEELPAPKFRMSINKAAELVQLFGPSMYHRNPVVVVEPKNLDLPMDLLVSLIPPEVMQQYQQQAQQTGQQFDPSTLFPPDPQEAVNKVIGLLIGYYLDYMQRENDKKTHSRRMIDEALIKGMGVLWTETYESYPGAPIQVGSFYDSVDNLFIDPDAKTIEECLWVSRRCLKPVWWVEDRWGFKRDALKKYAKHESTNAFAEQSGSSDYNDNLQRGRTNDLIEYYEIWSKMGAGTKLSNIKVTEMKEVLDSFKDYCYLVVAPGVPFFLNIKTEEVEEQATKPQPSDGPEEDTSDADKLFLSAQWPIPFWADKGQWPFTQLSFHEVPNQAWPMSHLKPGMGQLKAINWIMTFIVNKIRVSCRTLASCMKAAGDEIKSRLFSGKDFEVIEIENSLDSGGDVNKVVSFLNIPEMQKDVWAVVEKLTVEFERATGITDLTAALAGDRSAAQSNIRHSASSVRPDDMASMVEDCMSMIARKEGMAARWMLDIDSVSPVLGQRGAQLWQQFVMSGEIDDVVREFHYRVEAGSARKPNKDTRVAQITQAMQAWASVINYALQHGEVGVINAMLKDYGEAMDIETKDYMLQPPPPPPPDPAMIKAQADAAQTQQEMQNDQQRAQLETQGQQVGLQIEMQKAQIQQEAMANKARTEAMQKVMEIQAIQKKTEVEAQAFQQEHSMDVAAKMQEHRMDLGTQLQSHAIDMKTALQEADLKASLMKMQAARKPTAKAKK